MKKILFVCTGNTCRSPMAQAVFNAKASSLGLDACAESRGLCADGSKASDNAVTALGEIGISGFEHISKTVSEEDVSAADVVIGITSRHAAMLIAQFPACCDKIYAFPFDISDPYGGDIDVYRRTLGEISEGIDAVIREVFPECR